MSVFKLIKERKTIRQYQDKPIPKEALDKIIEAGIWGPAVPSFLRVQPWQFVVITNKTVKDKITAIIDQKAKESPAGVNILVGSAAKIIKSSNAVILIYNSGDMDKYKDKFAIIYERFEKVIKKAELSAISAGIQNMILMAEELGVGSCWLDTPLFCKDEINKLVQTDKELVAVLTLGIPAEKGKRSERKPISEAVKYIE